MIPNSAHFVFGLKEEQEPFHFLHYVALESCRRVLAPDEIFFHHRHLPSGPWWDRIVDHLTLIEVAPVPEVTAADYSAGLVPSVYHYAHHADFVRLDALIEHGGIYADIDTVFLRPVGPELFDAPFVIGAESPVRDEVTGMVRPSLCNAFLMAERDSLFARTWRERMAGELNGTWSNHSGFLAEVLAREMPGELRVEAKGAFFPFDTTVDGFALLFEGSDGVPPDASSIHLWAHLWWDDARRDFTSAHAGWFRPRGVRASISTLASAVRPYLPTPPSVAGNEWDYLSFDETSGYGIAAERSMDALEMAGVDLAWTPFIPGGAWGLGYAPPACFPLADVSRPTPTPSTVVAHLVPEYFPIIRSHIDDAMLVGHTVWETDRVPEHWLACLAVPDLLVVPSTFTAAVFRSSGVETPVEVVPHVAVAEDRVSRSRGGAWDDLEDRFVFYTIAEWIERKGVYLTIEAYLRAFSSADPVVLVVKTSMRDHRSGLLPGAGSRGKVGPGTTPWAVAKILARHPDPPAVRLVTRGLTKESIDALHARGDCFVSLCRSEGWGIGAFDAAAFGNPIVTTCHGGHLDYLADSPLLVDCSLVPVDDPAGFPSYAPEQRWAEPNLDHAVELLRTVFRQRADKEAAVSRGAVIRKRYSAEVIGTRFVEAVDRHRNDSSDKS